MSLKDEILRILRSGETHRIHFSFTTTDTPPQTISINHTSFDAVRHAIETNRIHVDFDHGQWTTNHRAPSDARYNRDHNALLVKPTANRQSRIFEALVVHECVHAFFDLRRRRLPQVDNEAAGYIAQGCYLRTSGFDRSRLDQSSDNEVLSGVLIADAIAANNTVPAFNLDDLRNSLLHDSHYQRFIHGTFVGNG